MRRLSNTLNFVVHVTRYDDNKRLCYSSQMLKAFCFQSKSRGAAATLLQMNNVSWVREFGVSIGGRQAAMLLYIT